jgi:hypothetical protein
MYRIGLCTWQQQLLPALLHSATSCRGSRECNSLGTTQPLASTVPVLLVLVQSTSSLESMLAFVQSKFHWNFFFVLPACTTSLPAKTKTEKQYKNRIPRKAPVQSVPASYCYLH